MIDQDFASYVNELNDEDLLALTETALKEASNRRLDRKVTEIQDLVEEEAILLQEAYDLEIAKLKSDRQADLVEAAKVKAKQLILKRQDDNPVQDLSLSDLLKQKAIVEALSLIGIDCSKNWFLQVWIDQDKRIFFQDHPFGVDYATYYDQGNKFYPQGSIKVNESITEVLKPGIVLDDQLREKLKAVFAVICEEWITLKLKSNKTQNIAAESPDLIKYQKAIAERTTHGFEATSNPVSSAEKEN